MIDWLKNLPTRIATWWRQKKHERRVKKMLKDLKDGKDPYNYD